MKKLPAKSVAEAKLVTFDYEREATPASILSNAVASKSVLSGTDPGAVALTLGFANTMPGTKLVQVLVSGGIDGVVYKIGCRVDASNGEVHELFGRLPIGEQA